MALWVCTGCTARYSVGAARCPQCGSSDHVEEGQEMTPKITVHGGPSVAGASVVGGSWSNEDEADIWPEPAKAEVSEEPSPQSDYEDWTVEQLKEQLADRGLAKSGKRDDLVQRLREDDDARATEPGAE